MSKQSTPGSPPQPIAFTDRRAQEQEECNQVLSSGIFPPGSHPARFLEFVCAKYFEGESKLSEHTIGVEALGRRANFDPQVDPIVRVEAHRIRKRLAEYYESERPDSRIMLVMPRGSYLPSFVPREQGHKENGTSGGPPVGWRSLLRTYRPLFGLVFLIVLAVAVLSWIHHSSVARRTPNRPPTVRPAEPEAEIRIMAGSSAANYTDSLGQVWSSDRHFHGGEAWTAPYRKIFRTRSPQMFLTCRQGHDFIYDIPLLAGSYELRLYFAETFYGEDNSEGGGESSRLFDISANDVPLVTDFDPLSDAGADNTADVRVFRDISPAKDGKLHLRFSTHWMLKAAAFVNGIEILRQESKATAPIRWVASDSSLVDSSDRLWRPDDYCSGGRVRTHREPVIGTGTPELFRSERYGHFSYAIPVAPGTYTLTLYFAEQWFGLPAGHYAGQRVFDVYCNGVALLRDFDIAKEAGGPLRAVRKRFRGLKPNAQGKLLLTFVPIRDYGCVNAIEVTDEAELASND